MLFSLMVAFLVTPWAAVRILKRGAAHHAGEREDFVTRVYRRVMGALLHRPLPRRSFLGAVVILLLGSCSLFYFGFVKVKMLPFDNKSEFQVIIDMPNGTPLEETARVTQLSPWRFRSSAKSSMFRLTRGRLLPITSTVWFATTICGAAPMWPTFR